jgi:hypothetical protein
MAITTQVDEQTFLEVVRESAETVLHKPGGGWLLRHIYTVQSGGYCYWTASKEPLSIPAGRAVRVVKNILLA